MLLAFGVKGREPVRLMGQLTHVVCLGCRFLALIRFLGSLEPASASKTESPKISGLCNYSGLWGIVSLMNKIKVETCTDEGGMLDGAKPAAGR